jgi:hypothetical protein
MAKKRGSAYLGILRGRRGAAAKTRLLQYLQGDVVVNYPERRGNRPDSQQVWVRPFGLPLVAGALLAQEVNSQSFPAVTGFMGATVVSIAPAANLRVIAPGLNAPRVLISTGRNAIGTDKVSQRTGLTYKDYGGDAVSVPFGEGPNLESEAAAFAFIRSQVLAANRRNSCSLVPGTVGT